MSWRWPWVRRGRLEAQMVRLERGYTEQLREGREQLREVRHQAVTAYIAANERESALQAQLALVQGHYHELVSKVVELKRDGYNIPVELPLPALPKIAAIPGNIAQAIVRITDPSTPERRALETRVRDLLGAGVPAKEVEEMVLRGEEVDV